MLHGRWTEENRAALEELIARKHREAPIAVFDWDNTCARGDIADAVYHHLCADLKFEFEAAGFWEWMVEAAVEERVRAVYEQFRTKPNAENRLRLRMRLEQARNALHAGEDDASAWAWDTGAFVGWTPARVRDYTRAVIVRETTRRLASEALECDGESVQIQRGLRVFPEMQQLLYVLRLRGWQVRIISASPQWEVEAFAACYGLPREWVVAMRREIVDGRITARVDAPVSYADGKLDAYQLFVNRYRAPTLVAGDSLGDWKLLEWATDARLLIEPLAAPLREFALWRQRAGETWLIQRFANIPLLTFGRTVE